MKIKKISIQNVTSYNHPIDFIFDRGVNILIGTNGGGKSNLQRILALTLTKYFIKQYDFKSDDNRSSIDDVDPYNARILRRAFAKYFGNDGDQVISIEIIPENLDIANIKAIGANLEALNDELHFYERKYDAYAPLAHVAEIAAAPFLAYRIRNLALEEPADGSAERAFLEYLRTFFIFHRVAAHVPDLALTSPVFFFSSERTLDRNFNIPVSNLGEQQYHQGFRTAYSAATGQSMNLMQWGAQHFVRIHRAAGSHAQKSRHKVIQEVFRSNPDVQLLSRYLKQMGYEWSLASDTDELNFNFVLRKGESLIYPEMFSSGEREIVHFLLVLFALNVRDGLVLVDEPELHLHPRWQRIFLGLFRDLSPERNNQFIITTHSPVFVTPETIDSITRIYRSQTGSRRVALRDVDLPNKSSLVRMINSHNNERLFFADKVVLVEGISDRLILGSLLDFISRRAGDSSAIEVIEVGGKGNFDDYRVVLEGLETPNYIVTDLDFLKDRGSAPVRTLFSGNADKSWDILTQGKRSTDRQAMMAHLSTAISNSDLAELRRFYDYFDARHATMKSPLTDAERTAVTADRIRFAAMQIHVLADGEIEDYLPPAVRTVQSIVEFTRDRNWINQVPSPDRRQELGVIVCEIIGVDGDARSRLIAELRAGTVAFPAVQANLNVEPTGGT